MPTYDKAVSAGSKKPDDYLNTFDREAPPVVADQGNFSRAGKRKTKHAVAKQRLNGDNADNATPSEQMDQQPSASPTRSQSILGQLNEGIAQHIKNNDLDTLNDLNRTQKVSDEHTPPTNVWARSSRYGPSPPAEPYRGLSAAASPAYEPGFSSRGAFNTRSPPVSPPLRHARPVSYGSGMPPPPAHPRMSTSPYGYGISAYGSPPALPHLPQQHFYGPHDIDLGLANATAHMHLSQPLPLKFAQIPGAGHEAREGVFLTEDGSLNILSYNGEKLEHIGALRGVEGTITDAAFLTWSADEDPFADYRPLVALTVHGPGGSRLGPTTPNDLQPQEHEEAIFETKVVVYSLRQSCKIAELLRVPSAAIPTFPGSVPVSGPVADLKVRASGNYVVISSGESGEIFIFSAHKTKVSAVFVCLGKYWTTIQQQLQKRDSSHGPASDADVSPADLGRATDNRNTPLLSLNGRWLAFCPAATPSRRSIGAVLGEFVVYNKNSTITAGTAPARPLPTCEVDSPDADSFLGKVAKGFAQEAVRSAKWISEKGVQTWQNYWKKDATSPPTLPAATSSSPPVSSPHFNLAQFPPTHGPDQQDGSREPEVVTILDLRLLQESHGKKGIEANPMATFKPPGGCSFLSFMPTGLGLLTANRRGDVQYVWDLMEIKYVNSSATFTGTENGRVRQIARYERLSPSTIVDVTWDGPTGYRFALLTKNRTVHIFDLPKTALQWPPPRPKEYRPTSAPAGHPQANTEHESASSGGFFASAMSIAGRTQPMLANLRGRAPSMNGGITSIGASGMGLASATGIKSGKAVAAGLSKSLGAATETVTNLRHANQSRLSLKAVARGGMICWLERDGKSALSVLDSACVKNYYVRMTKPRENRQRDTVSVFDARKAVAFKLPNAVDLIVDQVSKPSSPPPQGDSNDLSGFWRFRTGRDGATKMPHPLAFAEIETNPPYQPFHSDRRVTVSLIPDETSTADYELERACRISREKQSGTPSNLGADNEGKWVFGTEIRSQKLNIVGQSGQFGKEGSTIYCETTIAPSSSALDPVSGDALDNAVSYVVSSSKKRKNKKGRMQPQLFDDEGDGGISLDFPKPENPVDPGFDLLDGDSRV